MHKICHIPTDLGTKVEQVLQVMQAPALAVVSPGVRCATDNCLVCSPALSQAIWDWAEEAG